jgi:hypothetical protein
MLSHAITVVAVASLTCVQTLVAQGGADVVPVEFIRMLAVTPFMTTTEVAVGRLPDRLVNDLAPGPDMRIIGSLMSRGTTVAALVMRGRSPEVQDRLLARLIEKGWKKPPRQMLARGGFQSESEASAQAIPALCSIDELTVQLLVTDHQGDSAAVRLFLGRGGFGVSCVDPELTRSLIEMTPLPALQAPTGTVQGPGSTRRGPTESSAQVRLRADMEPAAVLQQYTAQMIAAGWQPGARTASTEVALQVFRKTDGSQVEWQGVLQVIARSNRECDLYLRVARER